MLVLLFDKLLGQTTGSISSIQTSIPVDPDVAAALSGVDFAGGDWTYLEISDDTATEEVKAIDLAGTTLVVERGASGSTATAFDSGAYLVPKFGQDAVIDTITANPSASATTVAGAGLAAASNVDDDWTITVTAPNFAGDGGITVLGSWPNYTIALDSDSSGCCPGEGSSGSSSGGVTTVNVSSSILQGSIAGSILSLSLTAPTFSGASGVTVTGAWPNYTITGSGAGGGVGTVTQVYAGSGISITGDPTDTPTIAIANTGIAAGTYGGITVNARGQITGISGSFNPIWDVTIPGDGGSVLVSSNIATITLDDGAVGVKGIVELADSSDTFDPLEDTKPITSKILADYGATLTGIGGAGTSAGESDGTYTNAVVASTIAVNIATGESVILIGDVVILDNTTPETPVAFGVAVFGSTSGKLYSSLIATQSKQSIVATVAGPINESVYIQTTAVPAGSTLQSATLAAIRIK